MLLQNDATQNGHRLLQSLLGKNKCLIMVQEADTAKPYKDVRFHWQGYLWIAYLIEYLCDWHSMISNW